MLKVYEYILRNANPAQVSKGISIWKEDTLAADELDDDRRYGLFYYQSSQGMHRISVRMTDDKIESNCDCPNPHFFLCEHQVAAILTLAEELGLDVSHDIHHSAVHMEPPNVRHRRGRPQPQTTATSGRILKRKNASEPMEIIPAHDLRQFVAKVHRPYNSYSYGSEIRADENNLVNGEFQFNVRENYYGQYSTVRFTRNGDKWYTQCACGRQVNSLCIHEYHLFDNIVYGWKAENMLDIETCSSNARHAVLREFDIDASEIDNYFQLGFYRGTYFYQAKEPGLLGRTHNSKAIELLSGIRDISHRLSVDIPRVNTSPEDLIYAFLLFQGKESPLTVIAGKPNKKGQISTGIRTQYHLDLPSEWSPVKDWFRTMKRNTLLQQTEHVYDWPDTAGLAASYNAMLKAREFLRTVPVYLNSRTMRVSKQTISPVEIQPAAANIEVDVVENEQYYIVQPVLILGDKRVSLAESQELHFLRGMILYDGQIYMHPSLEFSELLTYFLNLRVTGFLKRMKAEFLHFVEELAKSVRINFRLAEKQDNIQLIAQESRIYLKEDQGSIIFIPRVLYQNEIEITVLRDTNHLEAKDGKIRCHLRDRSYEQAFINALLQHVPEFEDLQLSGTLFLPSQKVLEKSWFFRFIQWAAANSIEIFGQNDLSSLKYSTKIPSLNFQLTTGIDWFNAQVELSFDDEMIPLVQLKRVLNQGDEFIRLKDGSLGIIPDEWRKKLESIFRIGTVAEGEVQISKLQFNIIDELFGQIDDAQIQEEINARKQQLASFESIEKAQLPFAITADLRPYQKEGFHWLSFLHKFGFGGCLADDMGLGKTVQVLCAIAKAVESDAATSLIIVPRSLLFNWENEILKFCPTLNYALHHGNQRYASAKEISAHDVIITTYGTAIRDIETLRKIKFGYIVLDESQAIKNPASKTYKAVRLLQAQHRLVMTGTPVQNNTFDLYAQMSFANPGLLGSEKDFRDHYVKPIDERQDTERAKELQRMIYPFVLRRTKEQVAPELPSRTEQIMYCELPQDQRRIYELYRKKFAKELDDMIASNGLNKSKIYVLEGLTRLRQICNAPVLVSRDHAEVSAEKLDMLIEQLSSIVTHHKVLVFSQFVQMLKLIEQRLKKAGIQYCYLDGQTKDRKSVVEAFQGAQENCVFLISLKAGGLGLNLTSAEYVIVVDPWWNPAAEQQAIDRTHRIGQDKPVMAYKLICKDTIEEKIMKLQSRKKAIAADIIRTEDSMFKSLTREDITHLFGA